MSRSSVVFLLAALWTGSIEAAEASDKTSADNSKQTLEQQRTNYQQTVALHGKKSPEAQVAKQKLREARKTYHTERRQTVSPPKHS